MTRRKTITDAQVREIRMLHVPHVIGYESLAGVFGCGISTIRDICTYRTRANVRSEAATKLNTPDAGMPREDMRGRCGNNTGSATRLSAAACHVNSGCQPDPPLGD